MADGHTFEKPFQAEAEAIVAAQRETLARTMTGGVCWSAMERRVPEVEDVEAVRQRIAPLLTRQAELRAEDAAIPLVMRLGAVTGITTLEALAEEYGLTFGERADIRKTLALGQSYVADHQGGWSKLPKHAVVDGVALKAEAA